MALDPDRIRALAWPQDTQTYSEHDLVLHALSVGYLPQGPDPRELDFVYERSLKVAPSVALTWCHRSLSTMELGIDYRKVVHAAQALSLHAALPTRATVVSTTRIAEVWDLGPDKGALLEIERRLHDRASGTLLCSGRMSALCRGDGGFGGAPPPPRAPWQVAGAPDHVFSWTTLPIQAALYRLQGDFNPLHIDPERARAAGFERPILHGLATFAGCLRALVAAALDFEPTRLRDVQARFSAPFFPGETLEVAIWRQGPGRLAFQARSAGRDLLVIRDGVAQIAI